MKVYLAGPINGCTDDEASSWRELAKSALGPEACIDPMRRDYRGREHDCADEIVKGDLADIDSATVVIANAWQPSAGTAMECWYAATDRGLPVIVVSDPEGPPLSPWWTFITTRAVHNIEQAIEVARGFASQPRTDCHA